MMIYLGILVATILCAVLYRMGGIGGGKWYFDTKARDIGCPLVCFVWMLLFYHPSSWWIHFIAFGLMFWGLTTYWDDLFGFDNFYFHGFVIGVAYMFYAFASGLWLMLLIRAVVISIFMGVWCKVFSNDWVEEFGRGGIIGASLLLLTF